MEPPLREDLRGQDLPEDELSETEQHLLRQMLDQKLEARLAKALEEKGVRKTAARFQLSSRRWWLAAAAVVVACSLGWWLYNWSGNEGEQLVDEALEQPFKLDGSNFRGDDDIDQQRAQSLTAYSNGDYETALQLISPLLADGRAENKDYFLAGLSSLYLSRYELAVEHFLQARALNSTAYADEISWHLGLAYFKLKENAKARAEFEKVANSSATRDNEKAEALLKAISQ